MPVFKKILLFLSLLAGIISANFVSALSSPESVKEESIVINEIAWMGGEHSYADEWIELYNNTDSSINFEGWVLKANDGTPETNLSGTILPYAFYLLERKDDNTVPNVQADLIYTGALENSGEVLELYDSFGNLIDRVDCSQGWFGGDNKTKQTMERITSELPGIYSDNWQNSQNSGGTPGAKNSFIKIESQVKKFSGLTESAEPAELGALPGLMKIGFLQDRFALIIALSLAIFSGIIILILKRKIKAA